MAKRRLFGRKITYKQVVYDRFSLVEKGGALRARSVYNCDCTDGVLSQGIGAEAYTLNGGNVVLPDGLDAQFFTSIKRGDDGEKREILGYVTRSNRAYVYDETTGAFVNIGTLNGGGTCVTATDKDGAYVTLFICGVGVYRLEGNRLLQCVSLPCERAACVCAGRVFTAYDDFWLAYSSPLAPTDFAVDVHDGGRIALRHDCGKIVGLTALKNRLCVLFEYGISMIELSGSARAFVRNDIVYDGGKIFGESVQVANCGGESAYFIATDGIYRFDGVKVEKVCKNLPVQAVERYACGSAVVAGKYLVTYINAQNRWQTVAVDLESGNGYKTFLMKGLCTGEGKGIFSYQNTLYRVAPFGELPREEEATFTMEDTDFSMRGNKTWKGVYLQGEGSIALRVTANGKTKEQTVVMQEGSGYARLDMRGVRFAITLVLQTGATLRSMTAEVQGLE